MKFQEEKFLRRYRKLPVDVQCGLVEAPKVEKQSHRQLHGQQSTSTFTNMSTSLGEGGHASSQQMKQQAQYEEHEAPNTTSRRKSREVLQMLRDVQEFMGALRLSIKEHKQLNEYNVLVTKVVDREPSSYQEVSQNQVWQDAMVEEYNFFMINGVWDVMPRPMYREVVSSRWMYKIKDVANSSMEEYKKTFMAKGYAWKESMDYEETFAPVTKYSSIRAMISLEAHMGWLIHLTW